MKKREQISDKYKWNIEAMYPDEGRWERDYAKVLKLSDAYVSYSGHLGDSAGVLLAALKDQDKIWLLAEKVYVYARMRRDEDNSLAVYQTMADRSQQLLAKAAASLSFFTPEFLAVPAKKLEGFVKSEPGLSAYAYSIEVMQRQKKHVLSKKEENLLAQLSEPLGATGEIFTMLNNADIRFGEIKNEKGNKEEVTHGNYITFMESKDRKVRKAAYEAVYDAYGRQINTLAATYSFNTKVDASGAAIRKYASSLGAALAGDNVPERVYDSLIGTVNDNLDSLHRYLDIRRRVLGVQKLKMYDVYVPLFSLRSDKVSFEDAVGIMTDALAPLGKTYISNVEKGVSAGWIDVFENEGKSSGAYSFGSYDSYPYILMNYSGRIKDVFTLVHEMGHSMHSYFTRKSQPFRYGSHSIFTAEVASTVNENLLIQHLLKTRTSRNEQKYFIGLFLEEFRTTLFRQTMFAEFERITHGIVEKGGVLTAELLSSEYSLLNAKYFGSKVETDDRIALEWSRIPHFYRAFYVYKYATGFSAAAAISSRILGGGPGAVKDYLDFLKTGDSADPIDLLKIAGVDMSRPEPVKDAMKVFSGLVDRLEELI
jgi:oligoendopeptidase F